MRRARSLRTLRLREATTPDICAYFRQLERRLDALETVYALSGQRDDVQRAVDVADREGKKTVALPRGPFRFAGTVEMPDAISLKGRKTSLIKTSAGTGFANPMLRIIGSGNPWRCSGIGLQGRRNDDIGLYCVGDTDVRVWNFQAREFGRAGIQLRGNDTRWGAKRGNPRGVIWDSSFKRMGYVKNGKRVLGYGVEIVGDEAYQPDPVPGDPSILTIEDIVADDCRHATSSNNNSRYRIRQSRVTNQPNFSHAIDQHGLTAWPVGGRWIECMDIEISGKGSNAGVNIRGGGGVSTRIKMDMQANATVLLSSGEGDPAKAHVWDVQPDQIVVETGAENLGALPFGECPYPHPHRLELLGLAP